MSRFSDLLDSPLPSKTESVADMLAAIEADLGIEDGDTVRIYGHEFE